MCTIALLEWVPIDDISNYRVCFLVRLHIDVLIHKKERNKEPPSTLQGGWAVFMLTCWCEDRDAVPTPN